ncbi:hypothetical protein HK104_001705 [Borealophlyctis nickersoniae]|nr:hypothetical protein HK104_001705 [Borealophlyctis nickersoniae]
MVFFVVSSLGEMAAFIPVTGSFSTYAGRGFGESESWLSAIKVVAIIVFILAGLAIDIGWLGGGPPLGFDFWSIPGAPFKNGIIGVVDVFIVAFFSFGGTELVGITAGEVKNPRKNVPKAINQTFWRILLFYISTVFIIGLVIRNDDPSLLDSARTNDITIAPFTLVFSRAGLRAAAHVMNGVILSAVLSAGNSAMYAASRTLMTMGKEGHAPAFLGKVNGNGVPVWSLGVTAAVGCLAFLGTIWGDGVVFTWLLRLTGISGILTWLSISLIHLRFRKAYEAQKRDLNDLPYRSPFFPYGAYLAIFLASMILIGQGYLAWDPTAPSHFRNVAIVYFGVPVFIGLFLFYRIRNGTQFVPMEECDFETGQVRWGDGEDDEEEDEEDVQVDGRGYQSINA